MQLMSWTMARLGSRFSLLFEPYRRCVRHSSLGRFLDRPVDLMVGLVEPDGTQRVLPFTRHGIDLYNPEQFERANSITFRAYSESYGLRFEFNIHAVFYPQDEPVCLMPAFYLEMRVNPANAVHDIAPKAPTPTHVDLFIRIERDHTAISTAPRSGDQNARIDLSYRQSLQPRPDSQPAGGAVDDGEGVEIRERIQSLNPEAQPDATGGGLTLRLPVTEIGSGMKWRLVWASYCSEPVLQVGGGKGETVGRARFRYTRYWRDLDDVVTDAVLHRDDRLAQSRRFEKAIEQAPLRAAERHLLNQSHQQFLGSSYWCVLDDGEQWFSVCDGSRLHHAGADLHYSASLWYLSLWPSLLVKQFGQLARRAIPHTESGGCTLPHDMGKGESLSGPAYALDMSLEENADFLLLMQAHAHWTEDLAPARQHADLIESVARYLIWTDLDGSGFAARGGVSVFDDAGPAMHYARKQTYLAVKRLAAINAAADLLGHVGRTDAARKLETIVESQTPLIDEAAWLGDHYAVCADRTTAGIDDIRTGLPLLSETMPGWDGYSTHTANGLLLPLLSGQQSLLDTNRLLADIANGIRETLGPYGCGHTSDDRDAIWISHNLWRDHLTRYLGSTGPSWAQGYWDLQVAANTGGQSLGCVDSYVTSRLAFHPRPVTSFGYLLATPRLVIDRLAPGGARICVDPDRFYSQRWPLLPLADWKAGKIPVCVVECRDEQCRVYIENDVDPVIIRGQETSAGSMIG